ncbi:SDR family oxidoreductase [bacterium AH-315-I18]|nr:SDR family oxidoreductase [bacterium AH-315-I18]
MGVPICRALAEHGAHVIIADVNAKASEKAAALLTGEGLLAEAACLDVSDEQAVTQAVVDIAEHHGRLDIAVNMTTYSTGKSMQEMTLADWNKGLAVSLGGAFVFSREVGKQMACQGHGSMIQFGSMYGKVSPDPRIYQPDMKVNPIDYGAAKAGIHQIVRYQAVMLARQGVRVNAVVPGPFPAVSGHGNNSDFVEKLSQKVPMGRVGKAPEIAGAVVFLASDAASYITGTEIVVDGGWTAW